MRIKAVCFYCGYRTILNEDKCPACGELLKKINLIESLKLNKLDGEQTNRWIESKSGYPISEDGFLKRKIYVEKRKKEYEQQKEAEHKAAQQAALESALARANNTNIPKCPICGSTNISRITLTTRAVKTAAFGVVGAVDDAGKTYKCGNCGCKF